MQSSVEHLEGLAHKLTVEVPSARLDQEVAKRLKEITPRVRIDGFRPAHRAVKLADKCVFDFLCIVVSGNIGIMDDADLRLFDFNGFERHDSNALIDY